jgi:hypothetical protein
MTITFKYAFSVLMAGATALIIVPQSAEANIISGGISFNGNVIAYDTTDGTGPEASDYISAHSVVFGPSVVSLGANGSFAGISADTPVTMYSPLDINPPQLPIPATSPLWSVTYGAVTYTFTLSTLTEPADQANFMVLTGAGNMSDGTPADDNTGTWVATFTTSGDTFSWNASANATGGNGLNVPEVGATIQFLGLALAGLAAFARLRKQVA